MKNVVLLFFILSIIVSCDLKTAETHALVAEKLADKGEFSEANKLLDKVLIKNPLFVGAYINKGANFSALNDFKNAIKNYNKALEIDSTNTMVLFNLGNNYKKLERYNEALNYYNKALNTKGNDLIYIDYNPKNALIDLSNGMDVEGSEIIYHRGITYLFLDSIKSSIRDFNRCISNNYEVPKCYYYLGINYIKIYKDSLGCEYLKKSALWNNKDAIEALDEYCK